MLSIAAAEKRYLHSCISIALPGTLRRERSRGKHTGRSLALGLLGLFAMGILAGDGIRGLDLRWLRHGDGIPRDSAAVVVVGKKVWRCRRSLSG